MTNSSIDSYPVSVLAFFLAALFIGDVALVFSMFGALA